MADSAGTRGRRAATAVGTAARLGRDDLWGAVAVLFVCVVLVGSILGVSAGTWMVYVGVIVLLCLGGARLYAEFR